MHGQVEDVERADQCALQEKAQFLDQMGLGRDRRDRHPGRQCAQSPSPVSTGIQILQDRGSAGPLARRKVVLFQRGTGLTRSRPGGPACCRAGAPVAGVAPAAHRQPARRRARRLRGSPGSPARTRCPPDGCGRARAQARPWTSARDAPRPATRRRAWRFRVFRPILQVHRLWRQRLGAKQPAQLSHRGVDQGLPPHAPTPCSGNADKAEQRGVPALCVTGVVHFSQGPGLADGAARQARHAPERCGVTAPAAWRGRPSRWGRRPSAATVQPAAPVTNGWSRPAAWAAMPGSPTTPPGSDLSAALELDADRAVRA
jgi:hypothetical protein